MMRLAAILAAAVTLAGCASGPAPPLAPPAPEPAPVVAAAPKSGSFANVQVVTSPGGITAWLVHDTFVPMIAMEIAWRGGGWAEPQGKSGAGWVLGYMMNEGAGAMDTTAYGARMQDLNMEFNCGVWPDWTKCSFSTLKDRADESFDMMRLAFNDLRMDEEPLERAKRELLVTVDANDNNPRLLASKTMDEATIPGHAYAQRASRASVSSLTKKDITDLKAKLMTRSRLMVVVVGDITADELKPQLDKVFGGLPAGAPLTEPPDAVALPPPPAPIVKPLPQPQTYVMFSGPGIKREDPDFFAAYLLNYILGGGGLSSRLSDDVREKRGLTYGIGTDFRIQQHFWRWTGATSTMNDKAGEVVGLIRENIARLGKDGPTQQELDDAKAYVTGAFPLAFSANGYIASNLVGFWQDGMDASYVQRRNSYFEAVTLKDLKRVAAKYMKAQDFTFVLVGQPRLD